MKAYCPSQLAVKEGALVLDGDAPTAVRHVHVDHVMPFGLGRPGRSRAQGIVEGVSIAGAAQIVR